MKKEAYFFSHDSNARNDEKIVDLRMTHGWEGYGLFWALIEMLRDEKDHRLEYDIPRIAFALNTNKETIENIISGFGLFEIKKKKFFSKSLDTRMKIKKEISDKRKAAADKRWGKSKSNANALQVQTNCNAVAMQGNRKETERKQKGKETENKQKETPIEQSANTVQTPFSSFADIDPETSTDAERDFELFYAAYPNPQKKPLARTAYMSALGTMPSVREMIARVDERVELGQWSRNELQWIPAPARYLSEEGYNDPVVPRVKSETGKTKTLREQNKEVFDRMEKKFAEQEREEMEACKKLLPE